MADSFEKSILEHEKSIERLMTLIPAKVYLLSTQDNSASAPNGKYMKNKKKQKVQEKKELVKKGKMAKLDPEQQASIEERQKRAHEKEQEDMELDQEFVGGIQRSHEAPINTKSLSINELRERLHAKIEALKSKRVKKDGEDGHTDVKSRQELVEKRLKKRQEEKKKKQQNKDGKRKLESDEDTTAVNSEAGSPSNKKPKTEGEIKQEITFGNIEFGDEGESKKRGPTDTLGKLKKAEAKQAKLEEIRTKNPEKAAQIEENEKWSKLMNLAQGEKVKDDPKLLKKTLKKEQKIKQKSKKEWDHRETQVKKHMEDRQKKRAENIQARKEGKKTIGKPKGAKKRPGFEGRPIKKSNK